MTPATRWSGVLVLALVLAVTPLLVRAWPAAAPEASAAEVAARAAQSRSTAYTGLVTTRGMLALPGGDQLSGPAKLLGRNNRVRVWWKDAARWRVATLRPTGETDLVHAGDRMVRWVYESKNATLIPDAPVRLPDTRDLLPPELARWVLHGAEAGELRRLPSRRVAGRDAWGLRLVPDADQGTVSRVDLLIDVETGVPLSAEVFARGATASSLSSTFEEFSPSAPAAEDLDFSPPPDANLRFDSVVDLAAGAERFSDRLAPARLAGLPGRGPTGLPVGAYGRGPTVLVAIPVSHRIAGEIRRELEDRPGASEVDEGIVVSSPPLGVMVTRTDATGEHWLLSGTVTGATLRAAANSLTEGSVGP